MPYQITSTSPSLTAVKTAGGEPNIAAYFESKFPGWALDERYGFEDLPVDSECGKDCKHSIDACWLLLSLCDPHPDVVEPILQGLERALGIFWNG